MKRKPGRPLQGKENKIKFSARIEATKLEKIIKEYGSIQIWIDSMVASPMRTAGRDE